MAWWFEIDWGQMLDRVNFWISLGWGSGRRINEGADKAFPYQVRAPRLFIGAFGALPAISTQITQNEISRSCRVCLLPGDSGTKCRNWWGFANQRFIWEWPCKRWCCSLNGFYARRVASKSAPLVAAITLVVKGGTNQAIVPPETWNEQERPRKGKSPDLEGKSPENRWCYSSLILDLGDLRYGHDSKFMLAVKAWQTKTPESTLMDHQGLQYSTSSLGYVEYEFGL